MDDEILYQIQAFICSEEIRLDSRVQEARYLFDRHSFPSTAAMYAARVHEYEYFQNFKNSILALLDLG